MNPRNCKGCEKIFAPFRTNSHCCSPKCIAAVRRRREDVRETARLNSKKWYAENKGRVQAYRRSRHKPPVMQKCKGCEVVFKLRTNKQFCNGPCKRRYHARIDPELYKKRHAKYKTKNNIRSLLQARRTRAERPWKILLEAARVRARKKGNPFTIDDAWCIARWTGRCELTKINFVLDANRRVAFSPSLDQIKANAGYTADNARFVLWAINTAKGSDTDDVLYQIAEALMVGRTD